MSGKDKRRQHIIPRTYLKSFCDPGRPPGHPPDRPFSPALWLIPKNLRDAPKRRSPHKAFRVLNAYTLKDDDPSRPRIEEALSFLETGYAAVIRKLIRREALDERDLSTLCFFVGALFTRVPDFMTHWQSTIDQVQLVFRQMDRAHSGDETYSDAYWAGADEAGKKLTLSGAASFGRLLAKNRFRILYNETALPFFTSDSPVIHTEVHPDELLEMGVPDEWVVPGLLPNQRDFLSFCPLTPEFALLACPLLAVPRFLFSRLKDEGLSTVLGWAVRNNAASWVVASSPRPLGEHQSDFLDRESRDSMTPEDPRTLLSIYTDKTRLQMRVTSFEHGAGPLPINGRMSFRTEDWRALRTLAGATIIKEATYSTSTGGSGGMRDGRVMSLALTPEGETVLRNGPGLDYESGASGM